MNVIFLDIDGVINPFGIEDKWPIQRMDPDFSVHEVLTQSFKDEQTFDRKCIRNLNLLVRAVRADLVLSSSWRLENYGDVVRKLHESGVEGKFLGPTPYLPPANGIVPPRGHEIALWLQEHPAVDKFVILDDDNDMEPLEKHLIHTNFVTGLTRADVKRAIAMFKEPNA
jgi:hypothetical protein